MAAIHDYASPQSLESAIGRRLNEGEAVHNVDDAGEIARAPR